MQTQTESAGFDDLVFTEESDGKRAKAFFPNGYGVSVIRTLYSYGNDAGLYELAVLKGEADNWVICYDTPITDDVAGYQSPEDVSEKMAAIGALKAS